MSAAESLAQKVKILVCDVDGVFTDGGLYYDERGHISKRFDVQDGLGIKLAQACGLELAVITGLESEAVRLRFLELGVREYHAGQKEKICLIKEICERYKLDLAQVAYLGDDWIDAVPMKFVGLPMAVNNAQPEIKEISCWISQSIGGHGAVREAIRFILNSQEKLETLWQQWVNLKKDGVY